MITQYITGNIVELFKTGHHIAHGCNCHHQMGAGIAGQLAKAFPQVLEADIRETELGDREKLGLVTIAANSQPEGTAYCFNLYTQYNPGRNLDYGALLNSFRRLDMISENQITPLTVYIPRIGAGIAGGDWAKIETIINMFTDHTNIIVVDWDGS